MKIRFVRSIHNLGVSFGEVALSAHGGFTFLRSYRSLTKRNEEPTPEASRSAVERFRNTLPGIGAMLFLLAFVSSEALATIRALRL